MSTPSRNCMVVPIELKSQYTPLLAGGVVTSLRFLLFAITTFTTCCTTKQSRVKGSVQVRRARQLFVSEGQPRMVQSKSETKSEPEKKVEEPVKELTVLESALRLKAAQVLS
jgi:hypothetical protein